MKKNILFIPFVLFISIALLFGLNCAKSIKDDSHNGIVSYWLDPETGTVHKMVTVNERSRIVSIIRYRNGIKTEVMDIIKSEIIGGKLVWAYYVPSTGYTVEMKIISSNDNRITVVWNNKDKDGDIDSGEEYLARCEEDGTGLSPQSDMFYDDSEE